MALISRINLENAGLDLSKNIKDSEINGYIREAELFDLRESFDSSSYYSTFMIETAKDPIADEYLRILDPYTYEYEGATYRHEGVRAVLVYYAYSRFVKVGTVQSSTGGLVQKTDTQNLPVPQEKLHELVNHYRKQADILWQDVEFYLDKMVPAYRERNKNIDRSSNFSVQKVAGPGLDYVHDYDLYYTFPYKRKY